MTLCLFLCAVCRGFCALLSVQIAGIIRTDSRPRENCMSWHAIFSATYGLTIKSTSLHGGCIVFQNLEIARKPPLIRKLPNQIKVVTEISTECWKTFKFYLDNLVATFASILEHLTEWERDKPVEFLKKTRTTFCLYLNFSRQWNPWTSIPKYADQDTIDIERKFLSCSKKYCLHINVPGTQNAQVGGELG